MSQYSELTEEYAAKLEPLLPLAKRAYGLRGQDTPEHRASAQYTDLVKEYYAKGGSLVALSHRLSVAYSGLRRRVYTSAVPPVARKLRSKATEESIAVTLSDIVDAKNASTEEYHAAIYKAYNEGVSLALIAKSLNLSSSAPLYYAMQRHTIRLQGGK